MEHNRLRADLKKLRESMLAPSGGEDGDDETDEEAQDQNKVLIEQYEALTDELERRREECIQLRTILANVSNSADSKGGEHIHHESGLSLSTSGEMPEADEVFAAYETQKNVIAQLQVRPNA